MITVESLTRRYAGFTAVDNVSFTALPGRVTGFLGPNGAGKSTTMRVMVGLTVPTSGPRPSTANGSPTSPTPASRWASSWTPPPSTPVAPDARSSRSPPTPWACPARRVDEMLELVSLTSSEAKRRVRNYSLGMRQRLGIGTALLGDPRVLILDEPANGLDPAGIRWMRDLLTGFASQGGTVLLSSHLLHEIEVIADDLVVIGNGKIVASGTKEELLAAAGTLARSTSPRDLAHALEQAGIPSTLARRRLGPHGRRSRSGRGRGPDSGHRPHRAPVRRGRRARRHVPVAHCRHPTRRSCGMTATIISPDTIEAAPARRIVRPIPTTRLVKVELRKMFNTRSGFWMLISIGVLSVIATGAVIIFAPDSAVTYENFARGERRSRCR